MREKEYYAEDLTKQLLSLNLGKVDCEITCVVTNVGDADKLDCRCVSSSTSKGKILIFIHVNGQSKQRDYYPSSEVGEIINLYTKEKSKNNLILSMLFSKKHNKNFQMPKLKTLLVINTSAPSLRCVDTPLNTYKWNRKTLLFQLLLSHDFLNFSDW